MLPAADPSSATASRDRHHENGAARVATGPDRSGLCDVRSRERGLSSMIIIPQSDPDNPAS